MTSSFYPHIIIYFILLKLIIELKKTYIEIPTQPYEQQDDIINAKAKRYKYN